jgi:hypothetical protein
LHSADDFRAALDPATSAERLRELIKVSQGLAWRVLENPSTPGALLEQLVFFLGERARAVLAEHLHTPPRRLCDVARRYPGRVLENPALPLAMLESPGAFERWPPLSVLSSPKTGPAFLAQGARHKEAEYRLRVAQHPRAGAGTLRLLWFDENLFVRRAAARHPKAPPQVRAWLNARQLLPDLSGWTTSIPPDYPAKELARWVEGPWVLRWLIAGHPALSLSDARRLQQEPSRKVQARLARATPHEEIWTALRESPDVWVQQAALHNAQIRRDLLVSSVRAGDSSGWSWLLENSSLRTEELRWVFQQALATLPKAHRAHLQTALAKNPKAPPEVLASFLTADPSPWTSHDLPAPPAAFLEADTPPWREAMRNPNTPPELVARWFRAGIDPRRESFSCRPAFSPEERDWLLSEGARGALLVVRDPTTPAEVLRRIAATQPFPPLGALGPALFGHPNFPAEEARAFALRLVSQDGTLHPSGPHPSGPHPSGPHPSGPHPSGLAALARDAAPETILAVLRRDVLQERVLRRSLFCHPALPGRALLGWAVSLDEQLLDAALQRANLSRREWWLFLGHPSPKVRHAAALSSFAPREILSLLQEAGAGRLLQGDGTANPLLSRASLRKLARGPLFAQHLVATHPNADDELLERLARSETRIAEKVAAHPRVPLSLLLRFATHRSEVLRRAAARSARLPVSCLLSLCEDKRASVRREASQNPRTPGAFLTVLRRAGASFDLGCLVAPGMLRTDVLWWLAARGVFARCLAAQNPGTPASTLARLLGDASSPVRDAASRNPSAPREVLALLWRAGASQYLQWRAAVDPSLSPEEIETLCALGPYAATMAALHPNTTRAQRMNLSQHAHPMVRHALRQAERALAEGRAPR